MTMNVQSIDKTAEKGSPKTNQVKVDKDQEKVINQLRQEIRTLNKMVKQMQQKPDTKELMVMMPRKLFSKMNAFLVDYERNTGEAVSQSELICDALDVYLWAEEGNKQMEEEQQRTELERADKK
jgi:hypothetical protein